MRPLSHILCARARAHRARPHIDVVTLKHPPVEEPLLLTTIERWHHTRIRGRVARVLLGSHTFAPYSQAEISSEVV